MATENQKAEVRPISFLFHNTATGTPPTKIDLVIRPESLTRTEISRTQVHQTLGSGWVDNWGEGVPTVQISGTTGWGQGNRPNGQAEFIRLHEEIFKRWHRERAEAIKRGFDPDKVKLIFCDDLDSFTWVVAPMNFVLQRSKSRPLLSQYQIHMTFLSDGVEDRATASSLLLGSSPTGVLADFQASLSSAMAKINAFVGQIKGAIGAYLGPIRQAVSTFTALTASALGFVQGVISAGMSVVTTATGAAIEVAANLARAAGNVTSIIQSVVTLPHRVKAEFAKVSAAFRNAFCVIRNMLRLRGKLPNYDDLYGASTCSSTAGGRPISVYDTKNPFPVLLPVETNAARVSASGAQALSRVAGMDSLRPSSLSQIGQDLTQINSGVAVG